MILSQLIQLHLKEKEEFQLIEEKIKKYFKTIFLIILSIGLFSSESSAENISYNTSYQDSSTIDTTYSIITLDSSEHPVLIENNLLSLDPVNFKSDLTEILPQNPFPGLQLLSTEILPAENGVKSVIISPDKQRIYTLNLEGMSIFEYDRESKKLLRKLYFEKTPAKGWDYDRNVPISSYEEKPVEACFSHDGKYLWVSLHNADGVVVWDLEDDDSSVKGKEFKTVTGINYLQDISSAAGLKDTVKMLMIKTGKTPKIITYSAKKDLIFISNWHSKTISVIDVKTNEPDQWEIIHEIKTNAIPRGLALTENDSLIYIAEMGGSEISKFDITSFEKQNSIIVGRGPRHLLINDNDLFASLNSAAELLKIDVRKDKVEERIKTLPTPRTIQLTEDGRLIFSVSYRGNMLEAFYTKNLAKAGEWISEESPVGMDIYQNENIVEVWVCNYNSGDIKVFTYSLN